MSIFAELSRHLKLPIAVGDLRGFREAQVAAIGAITAHFWHQRRPALVVMPTGSGKTAVMIAVAIALRATRVLVVAPSRLLREQLAEKFSALDPLRDFGAISRETNLPNVHQVLHKLGTKAEWTRLRTHDVVVGTPSTLSPASGTVAVPRPDLFDLVLFDEAHHHPAMSYFAIGSAFPEARQVLFTATPFRRDEREIRGDLIFTYDLARARADGVYGRLRFKPVTPMAHRSNDEAIARAAADQLIADHTKKLDHRVVVRASSRARADELAKIYRRCTKLRLRRVHSGLSAKTIHGTLTALKKGAIDGVVAVDMLGEGFDLSCLKIAALHSPHKSLAVTLQFIGRFARTTGTGEGEATFFAVPGEVEGEAQRLYVPGAEWNEIVEEMSAARISDEMRTREVIAGFCSLPDNLPLTSEHQEVLHAQLWSLRPYVHAKVYEVFGPVDLAVELKLPLGVRPLLAQYNAKEAALVCITRQRARLRWSANESLADVIHDMFLVTHVAKDNLVFVCTTRRDNSAYDAIIESVAGKLYRRLAPDEVNRILKGVENQKMFALGMRNRAGVGSVGGETYRTLTGPSADKSLSAHDTVHYDQGHAMCSGNENGKSTVVGFSSSSKVWSNKYATIPDLLHWFRAASKKLRDERPIEPKTMFDKLGVATRIDSLPHIVIAADLPHDAYVKGSWQVRSGRRLESVVDLGIEVGSQTSTAVDLSFLGKGMKLKVRYNLRQQPFFAAGNSLATGAILVDSAGRDAGSLIEYLNENPPIMYLLNLGSVVGDMISHPPKGNVLAIREQIEGIDWISLGVDPFAEKPPARKGLKSLFEYVEQRLVSQRADIVFLDDSSNEIADYVAVFKKTDQIHVQLFHCKAVGKPKSGSKKVRVVPNDRVDDLFEVLGQAVKCRRWLDASRLAAQVESRLSSTQKSRFVTGSIGLLKDLLSNPDRVAFEVVVVQPALSTQPKDTIADLLACVDAYQQGGDRMRLRLVGTNP